MMGKTMTMLSLLAVSAFAAPSIEDEYDEELFGPISSDGSEYIDPGNNTNGTTVATTTSTTTTTVTTTTTTVRQDIVQFAFFKQVPKQQPDTTVAPVATTTAAPAKPATVTTTTTTVTSTGADRLRRQDDVCQTPVCVADATRKCFFGPACDKTTGKIDINGENADCATAAACKSCYPKSECGTGGTGKNLAKLTGTMYPDANCTGPGSQPANHSFTVALDDKCQRIPFPMDATIEWFIKGSCTGEILQGAKCDKKGKGMAPIGTEGQVPDGETCFASWSPVISTGGLILDIVDCVAPTPPAVTTTIAPDTPKATVSVFHNFDCKDGKMGDFTVELDGKCNSFQDPSDGGKTTYIQGTCEAVSAGSSCEDLVDLDIDPAKLVEGECDNVNSTNASAPTSRKYVITGCGQPTPESTTKPMPTTPKPANMDCSLAFENTGAYFAQLEAHGCSCTPMPEPPRGWKSWGWTGSEGNSHYALTMAGGQVASFNAFCNEHCEDCAVSQMQNASRGFLKECTRAEALIGDQALAYDTCSATHLTSWVLHGPGANPDACVLEPVDEFIDKRAITIVEYPENTLCNDPAVWKNSSQANAARQNQAVVAWSAPGTILGAGDVQGKCTPLPDGTYTMMDEKVLTPVNGTVPPPTISGKFNCHATKDETVSACEGTAGMCDRFTDVAMESCAPIVDAGSGNGVSLKIFKTSDFLSKNKCGGKKPSPPPVPVPTAKSKNSGIIIGAACAGTIVVVVLILFIVQRQRAKKSAAYAVLSGSEYVN